MRAGSRKFEPFWSVAVALICLTSASAQVASTPSFEAASIKPNRSGKNGRLVTTPGRLNFVSATLKECLQFAYDLSTYQIIGPAMLTSDRYDIVATAAGAASDAELKSMLKTLLQERFQLASHMAKRDLPAYFLITTETIPKLTQPKENEKTGYAFEGGAVAFHNMSMAGLADYLSHRGPIDRPVLDRTGITGQFDFQIKLFDAQPDMPLDAQKRAYFEWDQGSSIFTDVEQQLGLKLKAGRGVVDVLLIDSLRKPLPGT